MSLLRMFAVVVVVAAIVGARPHRASAGGGPQNVALIVNPDDPDSLGIANYYIELRQIPASNVIYIPWRVDIHGATAVQFRDRLLKPLVDQLTERGLTEQIDFLAFSSGYPYLIDCAPLFKGQQFPPQARPLTSLTSAAFFYQYLLGGRVDMFGTNANVYFAPTINGITTSRAFSLPPPSANAGAPAAGEKKLLLATALGITYGHGNTGKEITASLRRATQADGTKPRGTIYYMQSNDARSEARHAGFAAAVNELKAIGVNAVVLPGITPTNKPDVAGLTTGSAFVEFKSSGSKLLSGAFVDNLTSAGGQMLIRQEGRPQTRISEYVRLGAAGASGAVVEPFAIPLKFPSPALHVHYARGCSLAEAFYQSVAAPFHLLVIGDPLCQPWAVAPVVTVDGVVNGTPLVGTVSLKPAARYPDARMASRFELYINGVRTESAGPGVPIALDTSKLADGWHELRVVAIDDTPIAVQGAWVGDVEVKNGSGALELSLPAKQVSIGGALNVQVSSTAKVDAQVMHNGRVVGTAAGGSGQVAIDAVLLGKGRTTLHAEQRGAAPLRSRRIDVEIR